MARSPVVIDASIAVRLVLPDSLRDDCRALVGRLIDEDSELFAPALWSYETTSALCKAVHLGHLTAGEARGSLDALTRLGVVLLPPDDNQNRQAIEWTFRLGRGAAYDSYYLAVAEMLRCDFWTADAALVTAASVPWVRLVARA
jgi:predicted nucleic acid-binding protein